MLVSTLWQSTLLLGLGLLAARLLSHRPARAHATLVACSLAAVLAPSLTGVFGLWGLGLFPPVSPVSALSSLPPETSGLASGSPSLLNLALRFGVLLWAGASVVLGMRLLLQMLGSRRLAGRAYVPAEAHVTRMVRVASRRWDLRRVPRVLVAAPGLAPAVWAWSRPARLFLPPNLELPELRAALLHELAHLRRRDHWSCLGMQFAVCVLPWHPFAWLARRRSAALAEQACDAWALASGVPPAVMARTLVAAAPGRAALGLSLRRDRRQIEGRIERMFAGDLPQPNVGSRWARIAGAGLLLMLTGLALAQQGPQRGPASPERVQAEEWAQRIERLRAAGHSAVVVQPAELDLGIVEPGSTALGSLWLLNPGEEAREVLGAATSCGCTRVLLPDAALVPAGGVLELSVEMDAPTDLDAHKTKTVTLRLAGQAPVQLSVTTRTWATRPQDED